MGSVPVMLALRGGVPDGKCVMATSFRERRLRPDNLGEGWKVPGLVLARTIRVDAGWAFGPHRKEFEMKSILAGFALATLLPGSALAQQVSASANMIDLDENEVGTVTFNSTRSGMLHVIVELTGLPPGPHGFHVHEKGDCSIPEGFGTAGGHYAGDHSHGVQSGDGPHPGDFPNIHVDENGVAKLEIFTDRLTIDGGDNPLMDEDGSAVIVHAGADDYTSQPSGEAGDRIACGVVRQ
jgi:Cu-Zn family superoxide dismutase